MSNQNKLATTYHVSHFTIWSSGTWSSLGALTDKSSLLLVYVKRTLRYQINVAMVFILLPLLLGVPVHLDPLGVLSHPKKGKQITFHNIHVNNVYSLYATSIIKPVLTYLRWLHIKANTRAGRILKSAVCSFTVNSRFTDTCLMRYTSIIRTLVINKLVPIVNV